MRISTQSFYETSQAAMGSQQTNLMRVQQQIGAMTKILSPSDDPIGATRALAVSQSLALSAQYQNSRAQATHTLSQEDSALQSVTTILHNIKEQVVLAGNGTLSDADRATVATTLQSNYDQLLGMANADDGNGQFLFAGFKGGAAPFIKQANGSVTYAGDQGQRLLQVDVARQIAGTDDGRTIFQTVQGGAGYVTSSSNTNTGTGVFGPATVVDANNANFGEDFTINFLPAGNYSVTDANTGAVIVAPTVFTSGSPIGFGGLQIVIDGTPANGDTFNVTTAQNAGTDMFAGLGDIIAALKVPLDTGTAADRAQLLNALSTGNRKMDNALNNVLTVRSAVGTRLQELDTLNNTGLSRDLLDKSYLSDLQDLDYSSAITEFYQRQASLEATQQTFVKIQKISLINFL